MPSQDGGQANELDLIDRGETERSTASSLRGSIPCPMAFRQTIAMSAALFQSDSRTFTLTFVVLLMSGLGAIAGLNYVVNPLNLYPTDLLAPLVQTTREEKVEHLSAMRQPPEGLILGSSRVLKFEPSYLSERSGLSFYNAGVTHAHAEDHVAMLRFYRERFSRWPAIILIGIDEFAFSISEPINRDLVATPELATQLSSFLSWNDRLEPLRSLVQWQQTKMSVQSLQKNILMKGALEKIESIESDGKIVYHQRERQITDGVYDYRSALAYNIQEYHQIVSRYRAICPERLCLLSQTLSQCTDSGSKVILFFTPIHPDLNRSLSEKPQYQQRLSELRVAIDQIADATKSTVYDFCDPASFDGDSAKFIDGIHPLEFNTRKMVDSMLNPESGGEKLAIQ